MYLVFLAAQAVIMLFMLRSMMQSSGADYYNPATQAVIKLTEPIIKLLPKTKLQFGSFNIAGFVLALLFTAVFWTIFCLFFLISWKECVTLALIMYIKSFGYLIMFLLFAQALLSWLPSTRGWSYYFSQITSFITAPVQKIIPPIGMIDISLMIVLIALFALNRIFAKIFGIMWFFF